MGQRLYLDANQLFYIRRIAEEAEGWDYGDYSWARRRFRDKPGMVADIRALCYIVALQHEWGLDFSTSDAAYSEVCRSLAARFRRTRDAWNLFFEGNEDGRQPRRIPVVIDFPVQGRLSLDFIPDKDDRAVLRHFVSDGASVFLTSDNHFLTHRAELQKVGIAVMRPAEWLDTFLKYPRGEEDAVDWLERVLFNVG